MKTGELFEFYNALGNVSHIEENPFAYAVMKNMKRIAPIMRRMQSGIYNDEQKKAYNEVMKSYEIDRDNIKMEFMALTPEEQRDPKNKKLNAEKVQALDEKYPEKIKLDEIFAEGWQKLMEKETEYAVYTIAKDDLPKKGLSANHLSGIEIMIKE